MTARAPDGGHYLRARHGAATRLPLLPARGGLALICFFELGHVAGFFQLHQALGEVIPLVALLCKVANAVP